MFEKESFYFIQRKNSLFDFGFRRVDGIIVTGLEIGLVRIGFRKFGSVQITVVENRFGQIGAHKIHGDNAAIDKRGSFYFQGVKFGEIQHAFLEMYFENEFVAHCKIDFFHFATIEKHASQGYVIDFCSAKNTVIKSAIYKSNPNKIALREIASVESTAFKFLQIDFLFAINDVVVFDVKEIIRHLFGTSL